MTLRCSVFIATSLDGFIARADGSIDWLNEANGVVPAGEDCGYAEHMATVDALVMGRKTYEQVLTFGAWAYGETRVVVMSSHLDPLAPGAPTTVTASQETPAALAARLETEGCEHLYIDGGRTIAGFLEAGLIDELIITVIPILLGTGIPLFREQPADVHLELISTRAYDFGFAQHRYRVKR